MSVPMVYIIEIHVVCTNHVVSTYGLYNWNTCSMHKPCCKCLWFI